MADVITRFKLETSQYDSKLRDTAKGLKDIIHLHELAGKDFKEFSDSQIQAARSLGQMATGATNAKDKVKELVSAYNDMAKTYNDMSEAMKNSEGGKALAASLQELQGRIKEAKAEMNATPGVLDKLASKFVVNIDAIKLFNMGLKAADTALGVAKDAFFASEATVDEWGRVMDSSKSLYEGFLTALNTGDISGYLSRIDDIVKAARIAYDELDRLGTMQRIQSPQKSAQQTENERMRMMIQTGRYIAPVDGRSNAVFNGRVMQNGDKLTAGQIRYLEQQLQRGLQKTTKLIENEVKQTSRAISALYDRESKELGLSKKEFMAGTSSMAEFDKRIAGFQKYQQWRSQHTTIDQQSGREIVARGNPYQEYAKWGNFRVDGDRYNQLVQLVLQREQQMQQAYSMQGQTYRTINRAEGFNVRQLLGNNGGTGGGKVVVATDPYAGMFQGGPALTSGLAVGMISGNPRESMRMGWGLDYWTRQRYNQATEKAMRKGGGDEKGQQISFSNEMANITQGVSGIVSGIEQLGIDIPEGLKSVLGGIQAVAGILTGISALVTIITAIQGTKAIPVVGWALARGGVVHAAGGYSVPGNNYSGDMVPAMLNSGELVLNKAQQGNLASQLQGGGLQNLHLEASVHGEQIVLAVNNTMKRKNKGELATFR